MAPFLVENSSGWRLESANGTSGSFMFVKEILREGTYQHPIRPWPSPLDASRAYLEAVARRSNEAARAGIRVPLPDGHEDTSAGNNFGWGLEFFTGPNEDGTVSLFAKVEVTDPGYAAKITDGSISKVSVLLAAIGDGQYTPDGDRVVHIALTPYPVASRQGGFVKLSVVGSDVPILARQEAPMKITPELAKRLGIDVPEGATEVEVTAEALTAVAEAQDAAKTASATALAAATKATETAQAEAAAAKELAAKAPDLQKALSVDPSKTPYFAKAFASQAKANEAALSVAKAQGKITEPVAKALASLLAVDHAFALSAEGAAAPVDVRDFVEKLLAAIPENTMVKVAPSTVDDAPKGDNAVDPALIERAVKAANGVGQ